MIEAGPAHAAALAVIHAAAFPPAEAWDERDFAAQLGLPGVTALMHPEGGLVLLRVVAEEAEILTLGVVPAARRRGVGRALLRAAMRLASGAGARTMFLEAAEDHATALSLYREAGFREQGRRRAYYSGDVNALVLSAELQQPQVADSIVDATSG